MKNETMFKSIRLHYEEHKDQKAEDYKLSDRMKKILDYVFRNLWAEYTARCRKNDYTLQPYNR